MSKARKVIQWSFLAGFALLMVGSCSYDENLAQNRPNHPVGLSVIQQNEHGQIYYISRDEHLVSIGLWTGIFVILAISGIYEIWLRVSDKDG